MSSKPNQKPPKSAPSADTAKQGLPGQPARRQSKPGASDEVSTKGDEIMPLAVVGGDFQFGFELMKRRINAKVAPPAKEWRKLIEASRRSVDLTDIDYCKTNKWIFIYFSVTGDYIEALRSPKILETMSAYCPSHEHGLPTMVAAAEIVRGIDKGSISVARSARFYAGTTRPLRKRGKERATKFSVIVNRPGKPPLSLDSDSLNPFAEIELNAKDLHRAVGPALFVEPAGLVMIARSMGISGLPDTHDLFVMINSEAFRVIVKVIPGKRSEEDLRTPYSIEFVRKTEIGDVSVLTVDLLGDKARTVSDIKLPLFDSISNSRK